MNNRTLEKLSAVLIIAVCTAGLLFTFGVFSEPSPDGLKMYTVLLACAVLIYYLFELRKMRRGEQGFVFSDVRCCLMMAEWNWALVSLVFLGPMHASLDSHYTAAAFALTKVLPAALLLNWAAGRKGTFRLEYILYSFVMLVPYIAFALFLGFNNHGFGLGSMTYPYPFMNADQLGWPLVLCNLLLIGMGMYVMGLVYYGMDNAMGGKKK